MAVGRAQINFYDHGFGYPVLTTTVNVTVTHFVTQFDETRPNVAPAPRETTIDPLGQHENVHYWALPQSGIITIQFESQRHRINIKNHRTFEKIP